MVGQGDYLITEPYDGSHVRVIASGRTPDAAEWKYEQEARSRHAKGYKFFSPIRYVRGRRAHVHQRPDREVAMLPTW